MIHIEPLQRLEPAPEPLAVRLPPPRAARLAGQLDGGAAVGGAALQRPPAAGGRAGRRHAPRRVRLRARGLAHHHVPRGHRGEEHVARVHRQGECGSSNGPWFLILSSLGDKVAFVVKGSKVAPLTDCCWSFHGAPKGRKVRPTEPCQFCNGYDVRETGSQCTIGG